MRIGLFGGTFNPIHFGHIRVAREIKETFALDRIYMIPAAIPPHKAGPEIADARDRLQMTRLAVSDLNGFHVSDVELTRSGPSYTVDTINYFLREFSRETTSFLLLGMDAFLEIDTWRAYTDLFAKVPFIVMSRPGTEQPEPDRLEQYIRNNISKQYRYRAGENCFVHPDRQAIYFVAVTPYNISSTRIREMIRREMPVSGLVPEAIERYIQRKGLYR